MRTIITAVLIFSVLATSAIHSVRAHTLTLEIIRNGVPGAQGARIPRKFEKSFAGTMGANLKVRMELSSNDDGTLYGEYLYERVGISISLDGKISPKGDFMLTERDDDGKATANFNGTAETRSVKGKSLLVLSGTWSKTGSQTGPNTGQTKALSFSLSEEAFDLGPGLDIVSKTIKQTSKKPKYDIDVVYPQISGASATAAGFNRLVESLVQKNVAEFKSGVEPADPADSPDLSGGSFSISYKVTLATSDLISVALLVSEYSAGAAHPNSYSASINYDIKSGKQLRLSDLFATGKPYLQSISKGCISRLKNRLGEGADAEWLERGAGAKAENYKNWNLTTSGLEITFDSYQVAAYAFGAQLVFLQYSELKPMIRIDGPIGSIVP